MIVFCNWRIKVKAVTHSVGKWSPNLATSPSFHKNYHKYPGLLFWG